MQSYVLNMYQINLFASSIAREDVGSNHLDPTGEQKTGTQDLVSGYPQSVSLYQRLRRKCNRKDASSSQPLGGREAYFIATAEWRVSPSPGHRDLPELDQVRVPSLIALEVISPLDGGQQAALKQLNLQDLITHVSKLGS